MTEVGVGCSVHFIPLHMQPYYKNTYDLNKSDYPVATNVFSKIISLPIYTKMTDADVSSVIDKIHKVFSK